MSHSLTFHFAWLFVDLNGDQSAACPGVSRRDDLYSPERVSQIGASVHRGGKVVDD